MKKSSLISVVNKSQYCDTQNSIGNVWDIDYLYFGALSSKQHTINTICMLELAFFRMNLFLFNHEWFQGNICDQLTFP